MLMDIKAVRSKVYHSINPFLADSRNKCQSKLIARSEVLSLSITSFHIAYLVWQGPAITLKKSPYFPLYSRFFALHFLRKDALGASDSLS